MTAVAEAPVVLYVDDELPNRIVFEQALAGEADVVVAADGPAALEVLEAREIAVLVTDMRMPAMGGDELLRIVKARWPTTVRMVMTAYSDVDPILTAINEGLVARYIVKPWERDELLQLVQWGLEAWSFGRESATLQHRLLETERLATLGSIAGAVLHDLNQPLAGVVINAERLVDLAEATEGIQKLHAGEPIDADERALIDEVIEELPGLARDLRTSAIHMRGVTMGLASFLSARPPRADAAVAPIPVIRHAMVACHDLAARSRATIGYDGPATLPAIRFDATELTQVLINLIANGTQAVEARHRPGGRVTVAARVEGRTLALEVRDDGVGMAPEVLARVGKPFFTTRDSGVGLGMAQCQRLVGKWGGTVKVTSQVGLGTTVALALAIAS
ncbi:MAG: response regulator [Kofleriaceae bacterium]|nr:response regulator [Myxococcales bacterium]MCB9563707.1 response regulator [Kofleriaceae bacterium]MCB9573050.1 response regulator [Kofleriaceae bacterium]